MPNEVNTQRELMRKSEHNKIRYCSSAIWKANKYKPKGVQQGKTNKMIELLSPKRKTSPKKSDNLGRKCNFLGLHKVSSKFNKAVPHSLVPVLRGCHMTELLYLLILLAH